MLNASKTIQWAQNKASLKTRLTNKYYQITAEYKT